MKTVLVTGSEGNIGQYLIDYGIARWPEWKFIRVSHRSTGLRTLPNTVVHTGDLRDPRFLDEIFSRHSVDYVVHAASTSYRHGGYQKYPYEVMANDTQMLLNVLDHSKKVAKFVFLSSALVYENVTNPPFTEEMPDLFPPPKSSYGAAKHFGEQAVRAFGVENGVPQTIWRLFNVVSPLEPHDGAGRHIFVDFYRMLFKEKLEKIPVMGTGRQVRCFLWVEDAVKCILDHLENPASDNQTFNVASEEPKTPVELIDALLSIGKKRDLLDKNYSPTYALGNVFHGVEQERRVPSVDKARERLGWKCETDFMACFEKFVAFKETAESGSA
jgi:nucleoside-diphosphate-sugar epimerase